MTPKLTLKATQRLKRNNDFVRTRRQGRTYRCQYFALFSSIRTNSRASTASARIGISASKRVGNAIARNRLKRRFREIFRLRQHKIRPEADIVISIRFPSNAASLPDLEHRFDHAIQYNGLIRSDSPRSP